MEEKRINKATSDKISFLTYIVPEFVTVNLTIEKWQK